MKNKFIPQMTMLNSTYPGEYSGDVSIGEPNLGTTYVDGSGVYWTYYPEGYLGPAGFYNENLEPWSNGSTKGDDWILVS